MAATHNIWIGTTSSWTNTANWSQGHAPAADEDVWIRNSSQSIDTGLNQSAVAPLASLNIDQTYTGALGTSAADLQISANEVYIGNTGGDSSSATGSGRIRLDTGTNSTVIAVYNTSSSSTDSGYEPVRVKGVHASNELHVYSGRVGLATSNITDLATFSKLNQLGGTLNVGIGATLTTVTQQSGTLELKAGATTVQQYGGSLTTKEDGVYTTMTVGGSANLNATGTITTLNVIQNGTANFTGSSQARTVTNCNMYADSTLRADRANVTLTNGVDLQQCGIEDVTLELGTHLTVTPSAI